MKKYIIFIFFISSCGVILINENNYRALKLSDKENIKQIHDTTFYKPTNINQYVYEINTTELKKILTKHDYTLVHLWRPYCSSKLCPSLNYFSSIEDKYNNKLKLIVISETYDIGFIKYHINKNNYKKRITVLQDSYYGHKIKKNRKKFVKEINNSSLIISKYGADNFIFKDTLLVYVGDNINKVIIDSVIYANDYFNFLKETPYNKM